MITCNEFSADCTRAGIRLGERWICEKHLLELLPKEPSGPRIPEHQIVRRAE